MRTEYALQEIPPEHLHANSERYWIRALYDKGEPVTDIHLATVKKHNAEAEHWPRKFRILSHTVSDWEEVK